MEHRSTTDNFLGDPSIGIPTVMPYGGYGILAHHNSGDVPATVDPRSMRDMMVMNAAYTYFIASAGPAEKRWMAELALNRAYSQMSSATEKLLDQISIGEECRRPWAPAPQFAGTHGLCARSRVSGSALGMGPQGWPG